MSHASKGLNESLNNITVNLNLLVFIDQKAQELIPSELNNTMLSYHTELALRTDISCNTSEQFPTV